MSRFSMKRATGLSKAKSSISRSTGIPLSIEIRAEKKSEKSNHRRWLTLIDTDFGVVLRMHIYSIVEKSRTKNKYFKVISKYKFKANYLKQGNGSFALHTCRTFKSCCSDQETPASHHYKLTIIMLKLNNKTVL
jgi:hypothetical protein